MELATDILRREHRETERLLERFESELGNPQGEGLAALARTFAEIQGHLASHFRKGEEVFYPALAPHGVLWISWPNGSSKVKTALNIVRDISLEHALANIKACVVGEAWSGLEFVDRTER